MAEQDTDVENAAIAKAIQQLQEAAMRDSETDTLACLVALEPVLQIFERRSFNDSLALVSTPIIRPEWYTLEQAFQSIVLRPALTANVEIMNQLLAALARHLSYPNNASQMISFPSCVVLDSICQACVLHNFIARPEMARALVKVLHCHAHPVWARDIRPDINARRLPVVARTAAHVLTATLANLNNLNVNNLNGEEELNAAAAAERDTECCALLQTTLVAMGAIVHSEHVQTPGERSLEIVAARFACAVTAIERRWEPLASTVAHTVSWTAPGDAPTEMFEPFLMACEAILSDASAAAKNAPGSPPTEGEHAALLRALAPLMGEVLNHVQAVDTYPVAFALRWLRLWCGAQRYMGMTIISPRIGRRREDVTLLTCLSSLAEVPSNTPFQELGQALAIIHSEEGRGIVEVWLAYLREYGHHVLGYTSLVGDQRWLLSYAFDDDGIAQLMYLH